MSSLTSVVSMAMPLRFTFQKNTHEGFFKPLPVRPSKEKIPTSSKFVVKASSLNEKAMAAAGLLLSSSMVVPDIARAADIVSVSSPLSENFLLSVAGITAIGAALIAVSNLERLIKSDPFNRTYFPHDFLFGAGSSAYQIEGAWNEDGKGPSNWDHFCHTYPDKIEGKKNGDTAIDFYHRYKDDMKLAKSEGLDVFRFSISWARIIPQGKVSKGINMSGIDFYNRVINEAIAQGIKPSITLFHWDHPQALDEEYGGFLDAKIVDDYVDYADTCFKYFGDRVTQWTTMNEPYTFALTGFCFGNGAPGRNSYTGGSSLTEPYIVSHNILRAHAATYNLYKKNYKAKQNGEVGIILNSNWFVPYSGKDDGSGLKAVDYMLGWYLDPIVFGDYPEDLRKHFDTDIPQLTFTSEEKELLIGSIDFLGLNYYSTAYASYQQLAPPESGSGKDESIAVLPGPLVPGNTIQPGPQIHKTCSKNGKDLGLRIGKGWNCITPWGLTALLLHIKDKYNDPTIYITECGLSTVNIDTVEEGINDTVRVDFNADHIFAMYQAYKQGVDVRGFYAWSLHDNFEWWLGYNERYGINFIDFNDDLKRYPKKSALWFKEFLGTKPSFYDTIQQLLLVR